MNYEEIKNLKDSEFKRYCGSDRPTFEEMIKVVKVAKICQKKTGRPSKLTVEDQILMTLEYWREYRSYFHLSKSWKIDESNAYRTIRRIEDILIKSGLFNLPGKSVLLDGSSELEKVVVDVSEHEIERPKKTEELLQW
jgi:hypothetical protein